MKILRKKAVSLIALVAAVAVFTALMVHGAGGRTTKKESFQEPASGDLWLAKYVGEDVVITFNTAPPRMGKTLKTKLLKAESTGIVLKFEREEIFFTFANIITVEPIYK